MGDSVGQGARVFVSYAHEDTELKQELDKHLVGLRRSGRIELWSDRQLLAGDRWNDEILAELEAADIVVLLVSVDFIASDFIWEKELKMALRRHEEGTAVIVPVFLRSCDWNDQPFARFQGLPRDAEPIFDRPDRDRAFTEVAQGIEELLDRRDAAAGATP